MMRFKKVILCRKQCTGHEMLTSTNTLELGEILYSSVIVDANFQNR